MHNEAPYVVLGVWGVITGICWVIWVIATNIRLARIGRVQTETQATLIERLGSSQELLSFLQTETGRRLLENGPAPEPRKNPVGRILMSVQAGILLASLGGAFFATSGAFFGAEVSFQVLGFTGVCLGAGFLLSAAVTYFLSKSWGLLAEPGRRDAGRPNLSESESERTDR